VFVTDVLLTAVIIADNGDNRWIAWLSGVEGGHTTAAMSRVRLIELVAKDP